MFGRIYTKLLSVVICGLSIGWKGSENRHLLLLDIFLKSDVHIIIYFNNKNISVKKIIISILIKDT